MCACVYTGYMQPILNPYFFQFIELWQKSLFKKKNLFNTLNHFIIIYIKSFNSNMSFKTPQSKHLQFNIFSVAIYYSRFLFIWKREETAGLTKKSYFPWSLLVFWFLQTVLSLSFVGFVNHWWVIESGKWHKLSFLTNSLSEYIDTEEFSLFIHAVPRSTVYAKL